MGLFGSKSLLRSGVFKGSTDWHCHVLPGVDDGMRNMGHALRTLTLYEEAGLSDVWLTPHIMEDCPNTPEELREVFGKLCEAYKGPVRLHLAAENMLDALFEKRLEAGKLLPIGENGDHLLVETSYFSAPANFHDLLEAIFSKGFVPVLAHPERYVYMDQRDYQLLADEGVKMQLNIFSLQGAYGEESRDKAKWLLKHGMYDIFGTDTHRYEQLAHFLNKGFSAKQLPLNTISQS